MSGASRRRRDWERPLDAPSRSSRALLRELGFIVPPKHRRGVT